MEEDSSVGERHKPGSVRISAELHEQVLFLKQTTGVSIEYLVGIALKSLLSRPEYRKQLRAFKRGAQKNDPPSHFQLPAASGMSGRR
jgi:hypothetical protein